MTEVQPRPGIDQYGRQAEIRKAHEENIQASYATIGQLCEVGQAVALLAGAVNRLCRDLETIFKLENEEKGW